MYRFTETFSASNYKVTDPRWSLVSKAKTASGSSGFTMKKVLRRGYQNSSLNIHPNHNGWDVFLKGDLEEKIMFAHIFSGDG